MDTMRDVRDGHKRLHATVMRDSSEQSGMVVHEGRATIELARDAEVAVPDLSEVTGE
jgi:hypothetical protein